MITGPESKQSGQTVSGRCDVCNHVWPVAYLPMALEAAARLMSAARCPKGCEGKVYIA